MYHMCMFGAWGGQRVSDALEVGLLVVVSYHMGAGNQTQFLCEDNKASYTESHLSTLQAGFLKQ